MCVCVKKIMDLLLSCMQNCQNFHRIVLLGEGPGMITAEDGVNYHIRDLVLTCSTNAYRPLCHYRRVSMSALGFPAVRLPSVSLFLSLLLQRSNLSSVLQFDAEKFIPFGPRISPLSMWTSKC